MKNLKIKKGDKVMIITGKDKNKTGLVSVVSKKSLQVIVEGLNIAKKHVKVSKKNPGGGLAEVAMPLNVSKVILVCPNCNKPTRITQVINGKEKNRVCKKCGKIIRSKDVKAK